MFSATVSCGLQRVVWKTMAMSRRGAGQLMTSRSTM